MSLAVDAKHPIKCFYQDPDMADKVAAPACPTHTTGGVLGPQLPAGDGGGGWDLAPGRTYEVQFPLVSNRQLKGPAGGYCPRSADELPFYTQRDCLITAVHVVDGDTDPWLMPDEELFLDPAAARVSLALATGQRLRSIGRAAGAAVSCSSSAAGRCAVARDDRRQAGPIAAPARREGDEALRARIGEPDPERGRKHAAEHQARPHDGHRARACPRAARDADRHRRRRGHEPPDGDAQALTAGWRRGRPALTRAG